jgi:hypothetical protein
MLEFLDHIGAIVSIDRFARRTIPVYEELTEYTLEHTRGTLGFAVSQEDKLTLEELNKLEHKLTVYQSGVLTPALPYEQQAVTKTTDWLPLAFGLLLGYGLVQYKKRKKHYSP